MKKHEQNYEHLNHELCGRILINLQIKLTGDLIPFLFWDKLRNDALMDLKDQLRYLLYEKT